MPDRRRRKKNTKRKSAAADILRLIYSLLLIIAAILVVYFVYLKVNNMSGDSFFINTSEHSNESIGIDGNDGNNLNNFNSNGESNQNSSDSSFTDSHGSGLISSESEGIRYIKDDGSFAENEWISEGGFLYYFDDNGSAYVSKTLSLDGMVFEFDSEGKVMKINYDYDYSPNPDDVIADYPSLVKSRKLWAFLSDEKSLGTFNAIMYKKTTEARSYVLGGDENPQFSSMYSLQTDGEYIYYLPLSDKDDLSSEERKINGTLYRMKPGAEYREIVAQNVEGYKVVDSDIFYMTSGKIYHTSNATKDETKTTYTSDSISIDDYIFENKGDALYLYDKSGEPVRSLDNSKRVGSFTYYLSDDGEITGVREKTSVTTGGWTYYTETDSSTGKLVSKIMRKSGPGEIQEVSTDFPGRTGNMFYDYSSGNLVAEYMADSDSCSLIIINMNGDVDIVNSTSGALSSVSLPADMELYALISGSAICKLGTGDDADFVSFDLSSTTPVAIGVISENIFVSEDNSDDNVTQIPSATLSPADSPTSDNESISDPREPVSDNTSGDSIIVGGAPGN